MTAHRLVTPLMAACEAGHAHVAAALIDSGADMAHIASDGLTSLGAACCQGHVEVVQLLLQHNVDVNQADINGRKSRA